MVNSEGFVLQDLLKTPVVHALTFTDSGWLCGEDNYKKRKKIIIKY